MNVANNIDNISFNYIEFYYDTLTDYYQMQDIHEGQFGSIFLSDPFISSTGPRDHTTP